VSEPTVEDLRRIQWQCGFLIRKRDTGEELLLPPSDIQDLWDGLLELAIGVCQDYHAAYPDGIPDQGTPPVLQ
jgi:hypothetical protein